MEPMDPEIFFDDLNKTAAEFSEQQDKQYSAELLTNRPSCSTECVNNETGSAENGNSEEDSASIYYDTLYSDIIQRDDSSLVAMSSIGDYAGYDDMEQLIEMCPMDDSETSIHESICTGIMFVAILCVFAYLIYASTK